MNRRRTYIAANIIGQIALLLVAAFVFSLGLGIGLSQNQNVGMVLWGVALLIVAGDVLWVVKSRVWQR